MTARRAAFLDRDGTIIDDVSYIARPDDVRVLTGAAEAIRTLNERGIVVVVITNQSGIAQGLFSEADYEAVRTRVNAVLAMDGARIDASYYCPHYPDITGPCACRKPGTLLYDRAVADLDLDAAASMFAGDRLRDVLPAGLYGGAAFLVQAPSTPDSEVTEARACGVAVVPALLDAVRRFR